jgi:hypothetical protein
MSVEQVKDRAHVVGSKEELLRKELLLRVEDAAVDLYRLVVSTEHPHHKSRDSYVVEVGELVVEPPSPRINIPATKFPLEERTGL